MISNTWTAPRAASKIIKVVESVFTTHGVPRFPLDVPSVALEANRLFGWPDPITKVEAANIDRFEGALFPNEDRSKWLLLYNNTLASPGRIRFTQAHELGHYILHRARRDGFQCGGADILGRPDAANLESEADEFASYLLMPIDDFRQQVSGTVDLNVLGRCADRYGVSLTAVVLKWLKFTDEKAVVVMSRSGFMDWAWSSETAHSAGAYFKTRGAVIEIPNGTLAADDVIRQEKEGKQVSASAWFKHADKGLAAREMKMYMEQFDCTLTLLILPKMAEFWPPSERFGERVG